MSEKKGYIVIEKNIKENLRILFCDDNSLSLTSLSQDALLSSNPNKVVQKLYVSKVKLDDSHEIWELDTEDNHNKNQLEDVNKELEKALEAANAANVAKSSFLSNMSHDIRTPMNAIVGMTSIGLTHIDEKARVQDCLLKIKTASDHLMSLVNDVLDMSRIDSNRLTLNEDEFSLSDLIHDVVIITKPQALQKKHDFRIEIGDIFEEHLLGDSLRLRQVLVNIISNAVKYTLNEGKILIKFSQFYKEGDKNKVWLFFSCEDNGIGMSEEFLNKIFIPFERVNNSTTSRIEGTGLGMAIVKNIVDCMKGVVTAESKEGVGSRFTLQIPLLITPVERKAPELPKGKTVLFVDSGEIISKSAEKWISESGLDSVIVKSGIEAVTWLTEKLYEKCMPCAVLLSQSVEDMPVFELSSHIRQLAGKDFPIILISESDWAQMEYRATRAGINAFVPCPVFKSRLLSTISELIYHSSENDKLKEINHDFSDRRILLVEDVEINQEIVVELLFDTGVKIDIANNGAEALEMFEKSAVGYYDLIFMDIQMPVMDGYEASRRIRSLDREDAETVSIIAMSANAFIEDIRAAKKAGMNEHCSKPVDPNRMKEILENCFKARPHNDCM